MHVAQSRAGRTRVGTPRARTSSSFALKPTAPMDCPHKRIALPRTPLGALAARHTTGGQCPIGLASLFLAGTGPNRPTIEHPYVRTTSLPSAQSRVHEAQHARIAGATGLQKVAGPGGLTAGHRKPRAPTPNGRYLGMGLAGSARRALGRPAPSAPITLSSTSPPYSSVKKEIPCDSSRH